MIKILDAKAESMELLEEKYRGQMLKSMNNVYHSLWILKSMNKVY